MKQDDVRNLISNCEVFMKAVIEERTHLEKELEEYLPELQVFEEHDG